MPAIARSSAYTHHAAASLSESGTPRKNQRRDDEHHRDGHHRRAIGDRRAESRLEPVDGEAPDERTDDRRGARRQQHQTEIAPRLDVGHEAEQHRPLGGRHPAEIQADRQPDEPERLLARHQRS